MKFRTSFTPTSFVDNSISVYLAKISHLQDSIKVIQDRCSHSYQGETPNGEDCKRRVCLQCGREQSSRSNYYWSPADEKVVKGGEYDNGDYHYTVEARLDLNDEAQIYDITWMELYELRKYLS